MTDQERKAMEMALEALDSCEFDYDWEDRPYKTFDEDLRNDAVDALRQALADQKLADAFAEDFPNTWGKKKHTAPPSKPWVSLTDEEKVEIFIDIAEAKLKEKNNG